MLRLLLSASVFVLAVASSLQAGDDQKKGEPEQLPAPKFVPPMPKAVPTPQTVLVVPYQRTDTREVWQHYAPNRMGRMVPRVIITPYGALYSRTLEPYPWAGVNPSAVLPIYVSP
jgi:hypothetical protein